MNMTICNHSSTIPRIPPIHTIIRVALIPIQSRTVIFRRSGWISNVKHPRTFWRKYSGGYSSLLPLNKIPTQRVGLPTLSVQMRTSGVANQILLNALPIALSIATYIISSGMSVFVATVQRSNLAIISLLTSNTPGGIPTYIESSSMPPPTQPMPDIHLAMSKKDSLVLTSSLYHEAPADARPHPYNVARHA
jgi:hypothetical protein